ncbi:MAG: hybrid sensor histidine kinase/response regulator, partial [Pseudobutyrivibrio sp.]|nr:hybrid sensor histidine kinase/response regulator [Pseudobutyrivibrio sp.]
MKKFGQIKKYMGIIGMLLFLIALLGEDAVSVYAHYDEGIGTDISGNDNTLIGGGYAASGQLRNVGYSTEVYDVNNGLETSDMNCIFGSSDGFIWTGGYSGLIRYDGTEFKKLGEEVGLTSARIIFEDSKKRIWIGTNDNGVFVLNNGIEKHYTYWDGLRSSSIRSFAEDKEGNIYIGTTNGISYIEAENEDKVLVLNDARVNDDRILRLVTDQGGTVYAQGKNGGLSKIVDGKIVEFYTGEDLGIEQITTILPDPFTAGKLYIGTSSNHVYYGKFGDKRSKLTKINVGTITNIHWMHYSCGCVWVSSTSEVGYINGNLRFHQLYNLPINNAIEMIDSDYQGNIWLASSRQGIMKIVVNNFVNVTRMAGLDDEVVNSTAVKDNLLYIGTNNGLQILTRNNEIVENDLTEYIGDAQVRCIYRDKDVNLWISTFSDDLGLVCQKYDGTIVSYTTEDGMPSNQVRCTSEMADGSIAVGTNNGLAIIKDWKITRTESDDQRLKNKVFLDVIEAENGTIFACTDGDGIYVIKQNDIKKIKTRDGLTSDVVVKIKKDAKRKLYWILTSNAIQYMKNGKITTVTTFPYQANFDLFYGYNNTAWVLSSNGIYVVDVDEMINDNITKYTHYTEKNGLNSNPNMFSYSTNDGYGNIFISGITGVSVINVWDYFSGETNINLDITGVLGDGKIIFPDKNGTYVIGGDVNRIRIEPAVLDYTNMNPLVRVYLEGEKSQPKAVLRSELSALEYTGLKYGDYVLHIQVLDTDGEKVVQESTFNIKKEPSALERPIVNVLKLLSVAILVGFIVWRVLVSTIIRRQYAEIRLAKDEAERANTAKSRFLANISHEIRTPINTIMGMNEMILREDPTDVPRDYLLSVVNYSVDIHNASESLLGLINDILDISKIESGKMHLVEQQYDVIELFRSIVSMIKVRS